jgi:hypothetical protein
MTSAALLIGGISTNAVIAVMGTCLGRGTLISIVLVLFVLPPTLVLGDSIIERTKFRVKIPQLAKHTVTGAVRVKGRIRGYISGMVDAEFDGVVRGQLDANVSNSTVITQLTEEENQQEGGQDHA